jgi:hypothetical protein
MGTLYGDGVHIGDNMRSTCFFALYTPGHYKVHYITEQTTETYTYLLPMKPTIKQFLSSRVGLSCLSYTEVVKSNG